MLIMDMMPSINLQPRPSLPSPLLSDSMWTDASKCSTAMVFICKTFSPQCCMAGSCSNHGQFSHQLFKETPPTRLPLNHITLTHYPHLTQISPINLKSHPFPWYTRLQSLAHKKICLTNEEHARGRQFNPELLLFRKKIHIIYANEQH